MLQNLIECIKLIISNVSVLLIYLINKPIKFLGIKDIQFEYTDEDKKELNELQISFNEIEISQNKKVWNQVVEQTKQNVIPTIYITKENTDEGLVFIPGKDFNNRDEGIEIIKKYTL